MEEPVIATDGFTYEKRSVPPSAIPIEVRQPLFQVHFRMVQNQEN
jgi:hypothetical protein